MIKKFGVVGHGFMGPRHVGMINSFSECECVAVCDTDPLRLEGLDRKIRHYTDIDSLLEDKSLTMDAVVIATPNKYHKEQTIKAVSAGKHVICEKPIALCANDLDEMIDAARRSSVTLTTHHQRRFDRDFQSIKTAFDQNMLGDVYLIKSSVYGYGGHNHSWHIYKSEGGGMLYNWGIHLIDQILYLVNSPLKSIYADVRSVIDSEVDDYFMIILGFDNGVRADIELGTYLLSDKESWFPRHWYMSGNKGSMYVDGFEPVGRIIRTTRLLADVRDEAGRYCGPTRSFGVPDDGIIITEDIPDVHSDAREFYANYIKAIDGREDFFVKLTEIQRVLRVIDAVRESAELKSSISLEI